MRILTFFLLAAAAMAQEPGWFSDREYENVRVNFEYKMAQWAEAAIVLRTSKIGRPVQQGVAVYLAHDFHRKTGRYVTGALAGTDEPLRFLPESWGKWHKVWIELQGPNIQVRIDGELVQQAKIPVQKQGRGYIHFADIVHRYEIRNFKAEDLGDKLSYTTQWTPFAVRGAGTWTSTANSIVGANGHGINYGTPILKDFLLSAEIYSTNHANGGIFLRGAPGEKAPRGFEVQIYSPLESVFPTGSIYNLVRSNIATDTEARWFYMQVLVQGRTCKVWVDGVLVATTGDLPEELTQGQVGLQIHMENTSVEWRNLRAFKL